MAARRIPKEFLGAFKAGHRAAARDFIDEDLARILLKKTMQGCEESRKALEFMTKFNNEYYKGTPKKGDPNAFHSDPQSRRDCYNRHNRQIRDVYWRVSILKRFDDF